MSHVSRLCNGSIEVSYPVREAQLVITRAEHELVDGLDNRVIAIKFIRAQYNLGLYEAKQVVDTIKANGVCID